MDCGDGIVLRPAAVSHVAASLTEKLEDDIDSCGCWSCCTYL